jgi:hypothetical protein
MACFDPISCDSHLSILIVKYHLQRVASLHPAGFPIPASSSIFYPSKDSLPEFAGAYAAG